MSLSAAVNAVTKWFGFSKINYDYPRWHTTEWANWDILDATLKALNATVTRGNWANSTAYNYGDKAIDPADGYIYRCITNYTSAAAGTTFAQDRAANPTYWVRGTTVPYYTGAWVAGANYNSGDIVLNGSGKYYICTSNHTANFVSFFTDLPLYWTLIIDVSGFTTGFYGKYTTAPTTRPDGSALQQGDLYYQTTGNQGIYIYQGTAWTQFAIAMSSTLSQNFIAKQGDTVTGDLNFAGFGLLTPNLKGGTENAINLSNMSGSITVDLSQGAVFYGTVTGATTIVLANVPPAGKAMTFELELTNPGAFAITWPTGSKWPGGTIPTFTAAGVDIIVGQVRNGGSLIRWAQVQKDTK